jgi:hypothetical protein
MTRTLCRRTIFLLAFALPPIALLRASPLQQQSLDADRAKDSFAKFAGTWEGKCQDDRTFVVVALRANGRQLEGTVSIGNMHGDDEGACMLVTAPPVPEHAQKINDAALKNGVLLFHGSARPDGSYSRFELKETGRDSAELKLLDTPVAKHPWQLVKVQNSQ